MFPLKYFRHLSVTMFSINISSIDSSDKRCCKTRIYSSIIYVIVILVYQQSNVSGYRNEDLCSVHICEDGLSGISPSCSEGDGVILLRGAEITTEGSPILGSCTTSGVFNFLSKVCNARRTCQSHWIQQIRNQCCRSKSTNKIQVTYVCIKESTIYDECSDHRHPVPAFHRHVISPNFTDEAARRGTRRLPLCQWSISIPSDQILRLTVNDLYVGSRILCEDETSFHLQYMDRLGHYKHMSPSVLCDALSSELKANGNSRKPVSIPEGSTKAIVRFSPISSKERLWFSYQIINKSAKNTPYRIEGMTDCGSNKYVPLVTTDLLPTRISTTTFPWTQEDNVPTADSHTTSQFFTTVTQEDLANETTDVSTRLYPVEGVTSTPNKCIPASAVREANQKEQRNDLQRFILIGALAGVSVVAVIFVITSLVLFMKLISRSKSSPNGVVRFIKADRLDSKPMVMEVECVNRSHQQAHLGPFSGNIRDRTTSMQSTDSPVYAMPYKQPAIRYGSGKKLKPGQHRVTIIEEPSNDTLDSIKKPLSARQSLTSDEDRLSQISGCTVSSSEVSVSELDQGELKELINSLKEGSLSRPTSLVAKTPSVKVRAEMRRPRFPPDVITEPVIRHSKHQVEPNVPNSALYSSVDPRPPHDPSYELCRPFPVGSSDYLVNPLYESVDTQ